MIPVIVAAKNEERAIGSTLEAIVAACAYAEARSSFTYDVRLVLDDTTDATESVARTYPRVALFTSQGGKVEAQRTGLLARPDRSPPPFAIFCDADVRPSADALLELSLLLEQRPEVHVATCRLEPLPPRRRTLLARALHTYNLRRGFSSSRTWINGKLFAMRAWTVPRRSELRARLSSLPEDPFYDFDAGVTIDDIFLSRAVVGAHGLSAIAETTRGSVLFRAPETWRGMNRYYRRMRRELERLDRMFPETASVHERHGRRRADRLDAAPLRERVHYAVFSAALVSCKAAYVLERAFVRHVRRAPRDPWPVVQETKG